jgi:O-antigen ligase
MIRKSKSAFDVPNPTWLLFIMAAILSWNFAVADRPSIVLGASIAILGLIALAILYFLTMRPFSALIALVASGCMGRLYVDIFGMKARPEHFAIAICCVALPFWPRDQWEKPRWSFPDLMVVLYIAANLASSAFMSLAPKLTLRWALQQILVILPYFLLRIFCTNRERFRKTFNTLLIVGAAQAGIGVFCFFSNLFFGTEFGMEIGQYGSIPGTFGVAYEANILGALSAASFVMILLMYLHERRPIQLWGLAITYAGMMISLARAAIGGAVIAVVLLALVSVRRKMIDAVALKRVAATFLISTLALLPAVAPLYLERFSTIEISDVTADYDTAGRIITIASALDGIIAHPLLGNGTASFQLATTAEDLGFADLGKGAWISNVEMRILYDTGIVGFTFFLCVICSLLWRARSVLKRKLNAEMLSLLLGCVVYAVTFQASEGTMLAFFWVQLGLFSCAVSLEQGAATASQRFERPSTSMGGEIA